MAEPRSDKRQAASPAAATGAEPMSIAAVAAIDELGRYLAFCSEHPDIATWSMARKVHKLPKPAKVWDLESEASERYLWHVARTMFVMDRLLQAAPQYEASVRKHLGHHRDILAEYAEHWRPECSGKLMEAVERVIAGNGDA